MFSIEVIIIAAIALLIGIAIGALLNRAVSPQAKKTRSLETRLAEAETSLTDYQQQVTEHFSDTAKLVNNLTKSYKDVHEHLAGNALRLANVDISRQLLSESLGENQASTGNTISEESFEPPKDWAPKSPGTENTLSESYGFEDDKDDSVSIGDAATSTTQKH